jgi:hypothetical protein
MNFNRMLFFTFLLALVIVFLKVPFPQIFDTNNRVWYRILDALYWLAVSYLPAYLVYLFVDYLPKQRDLSRLSVFIANQTAMVIGDGQYIFTELSKAANQMDISVPSAQDFNNICININPNDNAPLLKHFPPPIYANWIEFLQMRKARSERDIDLLLRYMPYLDAEHIRLLTEINGSVLFVMLDSINQHPIKNNDLSFLSQPLFGYYSLTRELANYSDKYMKGIAWSKPRR